MKSEPATGELARREESIVPRSIGISLMLFAGSLALALLSARELWKAGMLAFGDLPRFPSDPLIFANGFLSAWSDRGLGGPFTSSPAVLFAAELLVLTNGHGALAQHLYVTLWIPVAFCGLAYLCRRFAGASWLLAVIGAIVYVATPVSIGLVIAGAGGLIWAYALAPWVIVGAERIQSGSSSAIASFAVALALLAAFSVELLVFGVLIGIVWFIIGPERREAAVGGGVALSLAAVVALPSLVGRGSISVGPGLIEKAINDFRYTYAEVTPHALARLAGNQGDPMDALGYNGGAGWTYVGYLPIIAAAFGLALRRKDDRFPIRMTLLAVLAACLLVAIAVVARTTPNALGEVPPVFVFRNPEKLMILLAAALVPASVYGVQRLFETFPKRRTALGFGVVGSLVVYLGIYATPAVSGHWGVEMVRSSYTADDALLASAEYLKRQDPSLAGRWRVVWVPFEADDVRTLEWTLPQWANEPVLESRDPHVEETTALLEDALEDADLRRFHVAADRASVRYVIARETADPRVRRAFTRDVRLEHIHRGRGFDIWRNRSALPRIRPFSRLKLVVTPERSDPVEYESRPLLRLARRPLLTAPRGTPDLRSAWTAHPRQNFRRIGRAIRIRGTHSQYWPTLTRRIRVDGDTSYVISAHVRTKNAAAAHLKVIWYRGSRDREAKALEHDYAEPILSGDHGWTRLSDIVTSPPAARFADIAFLAGERPVGSRTAAISWVRDLEIVNRYVSDAPSTRTGAVADVIPDIAHSGDEFVHIDSLEPVVATRNLAELSPDAVVVNPRSRGGHSQALRALREHGGRMEIAARAEVALQPRRGAWRRSGDSVEVASARAEASLPLGVVKRGRYMLSVSGCRFRSGSIRIVRPTGTLRPRFSRKRGCGRWRTTEPVTLAGRSALAFSLPRDASIASVHASPVNQRTSASTADAVTIGRADTPSPSIRGLSSRGFILADTFHPEWRTSGSSASHFQTFLGFNGFLVDDPAELSGLSYRPQRTRELLLVVSAIGWAVLAILGWMGARRSRRLFTASRTDTSRPPGGTRVGAGSRDPAPH